MNNLKYCFLFFTCVLLAASCQKKDDNGCLGAFWKLLEVEYVADGTKIDCSRQSLFMAVQLDLMQFSGNGLCYARFRHSGDSLYIRVIDDMADEELLERFGMNGHEQRFAVKKINSNSLILESEYSKLRFKKF